MHLTLLVVLHIRLPSVRDHPSRDEVVVVRIESVRPPRFVREAEGEFWVLKNVSPVGDSSTGQTREASVQVRAGRDVKVPSLQIACTQQVPNVRICLPPQTLRRANTTHAGIFKWREDPRKNPGRPDHVVVGEKGYFGLNLGNGPAHLASFVCLVDAQDSDPLGGKCCRHLTRPLETGIYGNENDLCGFRPETSPDGLSKLFPISGDGGNDNRDILAGI